MDDPVVDYLPVFVNLNISSLVFSSLIALFIAGTRILKFRAAKRLSYRIYMWIAISDILTHIIALGSFEDSTPLCRAMVQLSNWTNLVTVSFTCVLAFNIHVVFIMAKPQLVRSEIMYVVLCILIPTIIMIPSAFMAYFFPKYCDPFFSFKPIPMIVLFWACSGIWIAIGTIYCFVVFVIVINRIIHHKKMDHCGSLLTGRHLKRIVTRLILYPLAPVICLFPYMIAYTLIPFVPQEHDITLSLVQLICTSIQGIVNFIFFLADPALPDIIGELRGTVPSYSTYGSTTKCTESEEDKVEINDLTQGTPSIAASENPVANPRFVGPASAHQQGFQTFASAHQYGFNFFNIHQQQTIPQKHWARLV